MGPEAAPELGRSGASAQEARRIANRRKVREHRQRLRAQGMRPIQSCLPYVPAPQFAAEARPLWLLANASPVQASIPPFIDSVYQCPADQSRQRSPPRLVTLPLVPS